MKRKKYDAMYGSQIMECQLAKVLWYRPKFKLFNEGEIEITLGLVVY